MTQAHSLPERVATPADIQIIESASEVAHTPCGDGTLIWHIWNKPPAGTDASEPPVLLLHGGSGSWNHWVRNISALVRDGHCVYVPDLPSFGASASLPSGADADAMPEWIETGLQVLTGSQAFSVVGFSFGAMVATLLASRFPTRAARLVLVGSPALSVQPLRSLGLRAWNHLPAGEARNAVIAQNMMVLMLSSEDTLDEMTLALQVDNLSHDRLHGRRLSQTDLVARALPTIQCRVWGIWGHDDALYVGRQDSIAPVLANAPHFKTLSLIAGAGHWVQYEQSEAFDAALKAALTAT
ncbi:alpha/beta fold hydrolase [soil metagenome]